MAQAAVQTETEIANLALDRLGLPPVTTLDTSITKKQRAIRRNFGTVRDALLRQYPWNFAEARASLAADATAPVAQFDHRYQVPSDPYCLHVRRVLNAGQREWKVAGRYILADLTAPLTIIYTARVESVAAWDDLFKTVFVHGLAAALAGPLARDDRAARRERAMVEEAMAAAAPADAVESAAEPTEDGDWLAAYEQGF